MNETQNQQETTSTPPTSQAQENLQQPPNLDKPAPALQKNKKVHTIIVSTLLVISIGVGGYYTNNYFNSSKKVQTSQKPTTTPTENHTNTSTITNPTPYPKPLEPLTSNLLFTSNKVLYRTDGVEVEKIFELEKHALDILPSPSGNYAAVVVRSHEELSPYSYPKGKLSVIELKSGKVSNIINDSETVVRYPSWSSDENYLSFWINNGEESFLYDVKANSPIFSIKSSSEESVSPIVFVNRNTISYIQDSKLYLSNLNGSNKEIIAEDVSAVRPVHEGPSLPNLPMFSPNEKFVHYMSKNGDFVVLSLENETSFIKQLESDDDSMFSNYPEYFPIGFLNNNEFMFKGGSYSYDEPSPVYLLDLPTMTQSNLSDTIEQFSKGGVSLTAVFVSPKQNEFIIPGLQVLNLKGDIIHDCSDSNFKYENYYWGGGPNYASSLKVWSTDAKYIVSDNGLSVLELDSCDGYNLFDDIVEFSTWLPN